MNILNRIKNIWIIAMAFFVFGCEEGFDDINIDPNSPVSVPASTLLTNGIFNVTYTYWDRDCNFEFGELMVQHLAQNEYTEEQNYSFSQSDFNFRWGNLYSGQNVSAPTGGLYDLAVARDMISLDESLSDAQRANQLAVIDIFMAFGFQMITDLWGDIPYSQAFNAGDYPFPVYDTQQSVYNGLISTVSAAVDTIDPSAKGFATGDILFDGDMSSWQNFGNAMLIRLGMRLALADEQAAVTAVSKGFSGVLPSADVSLVFDANQDLANPFYQDRVISSRDDFRISEILVEEMKALNDPRLTKYAEPAPGSTQIIGMPYGLSDAGAFELKNSTSDLHGDIEFNPLAPAYLISLAELEFFRAEAIARGYISGNAESAYNDAIRASLAQWGVDKAEIEAYLNEPEVAYDKASLAQELQSIAKQKWIALYTNGVEAYAEWRRLDYPQLNVGTGAFESSIPLRMLYPTTEDGTNGENMAVANNGSNTLSSAVWWDK